MSDAERQLAAFLGGGFTTYVGCDEQIKQRVLKPKKRQQTFMSELDKKKLSEKLKKIEELRRKTYLNGVYSFQRVLEMTCAVYCISEEQLLSARRFVKLVRARQQIIRIMREQRGTAYLELGRRLNRDHSTIIHSYASAKANPAPLQEAYDEIMERLKS